MPDFPVVKTVAVPNVTPIQVKHINNLEDKVGTGTFVPDANADANVNSLDYQVRARLETTTFNIDHDSVTGHHKLGVWNIGATPVTSSAAELNKLTGTSANVNAANLNTLTAGSGSNASLLHSHTTSELRAENGYTLLPSGLYIMWGYGAWGKAESSQTVNFPLTFPTLCLHVDVTTEQQSASTACNSWFQLVNGTITTTGFACFRQREEAAPSVNTRPRYIAIGY